MFFRENQPSIIQLDSHVSYFLKGQTALFSGFQLDYHNSTIDLNLGYKYSFLEKSHYYQISELSVVFPFLFEGWKMTLGVRDVLWSSADRYWNYGLWQPRYLLDPLRPKQMGLPGLYFDYRANSTSLLLSLSYFHIPDVIILPKLKNNQIVSRNPFFINSFNQLKWDVKKLNLFEINRFFKPAIAFNVRHFIQNSSINFSYAYKPINQFQKAVFLKSVNVTDIKPNKLPSVLTVTNFKYLILHHHLASLEAETYFSENVSLFTSVFYEKPEQKEQEQEWISYNFAPHVTFSVIAYFQEKWEKDQKTLFTLGWTKTVDSPPALDSNPILSEYRKEFSGNFDWKSAVGASIEYENKKMFQGFLFRFRANYALDKHFCHFMLENYFYFTDQVRVYLSGDLLFRLSSKKPPVNGSAIEQYDGLNRFLLGGQYVF